MTTTKTLPDSRIDALDNPAAAVELDHVTKRYGRRAVPALDTISVRFEPGSYTAVMGLSGSGKSTLLHCAAGLDRPSAGRVRIGGVELTKLSRRRLSMLRRRRVGFVFQSLNLVPTLTVAENIALPLRLDHRRAPAAEIARMAERVGISGLLRRLPHTLSGGQQQRVAIARALITEPDVVFADEPTAALDPVTAGDISRLLRAAVDDLARTVVLVSHDPVLASSADRALVLHQGRVVADLDEPDQAQLAHQLRLSGGAR